MDRSAIFTALVLFGSLTLLQIQAFRQPHCRGKETKLTPEELKLMTDCVQEFGKGATKFSELTKESLGCVGKCILQRQGLVDKDGKPVKDNVFKIVNETLEADVAKLADEKLGKCIDDNGGGIDANGCESYVPLVQCVAATFMEICADPNETTEKSK